VLLDPFCGTGTALVVATELGRRAVGIDVAEEYLALARERCGRRS
jgi:DNA modification methylase